MSYEFPEGFEFDLPLFDHERNKEAIICAAKYMDDHPDLKPSFTQIANAVVNTDDETAAMTKAVFAEIGEETDHCLPFLGVYFPLYARAVITIKEHGWDAFIEAMTPSKEAVEA